MTCKICNKDKELRMGTCFDCAEAESILFGGTDMHDKGLNGSNKPAKSSLEKLKLLIEKGWIFSK